MSAREPSPWAPLAGSVEPPPWQGPAHVHRLLSAGDAEPEPVEPADPVRKCSKCGDELPLTKQFFYRHKSLPGGFRPDCKDCHGKLPSTVRQSAISKRPRAPVQELEQLAERAGGAVLQALPAWTLIEPGSPHEDLLRKAPAALWWQLAPKS